APGGKKPSSRGPNKKGKGARNVSSKAVAAARKKDNTNRNQLIIGGSAILVIVIVIAVGVMLNRKSSQIPEADYGDSVASTATIGGANGEPDVQIDVYEDALCPYCRLLEEQDGPAMAKAVDDGELSVRYFMIDFLNSGSASGDYSTRAYAALLAVADIDGDEP